jgi:hypothetical protein
MFLKDKPVIVKRSLTPLRRDQASTNSQVGKVSIYDYKKISLYIPETPGGIQAEAD